MHESQDPEQSSQMSSEKIAGFPLLELPQLLVIQILEKISFGEYISLLQCSRRMKFLSDRISGRIPLEVDAVVVEKDEEIMIHPLEEEWSILGEKVGFEIAKEFPARIDCLALIVKKVLSSELCIFLCEEFQRNKTTAYEVNMRSDMSCSYLEFAELLETLNPNMLLYPGFLDSDYFDQPVIQKMEHIRIGKCIMSDQQLLTLNFLSLRMKCDTVTAAGVNELLKSWKRGSRELERVYIVFETNQTSYEPFLHDLKANPIWSPELHSDSILSKLPLQDVQFRTSSNFYAIFRSNDIYNPKYIDISQRIFRMQWNSDFDCVLDFLSSEQFYVITGRCKHCKTRVCEHIS